MKTFLLQTCVVLTTVFLCSASAIRHPDVAALPNILLILTDDQGYYDVSYYGTKDVRTPYIDQLTGAGMRFDNFYANCPVCSPTRAALLSGRYQDYVGVPGVICTHAEDSWGYLDPEAVLLPSRLKKVGDHTALVGKWHLGLKTPNTPNERSFDYFHGWLGDMMDDYWTHRRHEINYMRLNKQIIDPKGHATDLFTRREGGTQYGGQCIYALRLGDWKLLQNSPYQPIELYNLKQAPLEQHNVIKEQPEMYKKLHHLLRLHIQAGGRVPWQQPARLK